MPANVIVYLNFVDLFQRSLLGTSAGGRAPTSIANQGGALPDTMSAGASTTAQG